MSYYPEPDSYMRNKVKVVLDLSNYTTKKVLDHAKGVDTSGLTAKKDFIVLKAEDDKLTNVPTSLNNLIAKLDDLDVGKFKTVPLDLKIGSDVLANEGVKNTKFNTLKTKVNSSETKIPDATSLIHIDRYNLDKHALEKKIEDIDKKTDTSGLVTETTLHTKISEVENKIPDTSSLVATTVLNKIITEIENEIPNHDKYITTPEFNKLTAEHFAARLKQSDLVIRTDFDNKGELLEIKQKNLEVQKKLDNLITRNYKFFLGRIYFTRNDGS